MKTVRTDPWTCAPILGGFCSNNETCAADNAVCVNSECKCKKGYFQRPNNQCVRNVLGTRCENDEACNLVKFAKCSEYKVCACTSNTTAITSIYCAPIFGGFCWENDECVTLNSICLNNKCQCHGKYNQYTTEKGCVSNEIVCEADNWCVVENSGCIDNFCQCKPQFGYRSNQCLPLAHLNDFCLLDYDCREIDHAICSKDNKCKCDENYVAVNQTSCRPISGGICSKNKDCGNINGACIDSKCGCMPFMVKFSKYLCLAPQLGIPCKSNEDCRKILNSICSDNGICECKINFGEYNSTACASLLGESCFENQLCVPLHSNCKNDICLCDDGFLDYSKKKCIPHSSDWDTILDCIPQYIFNMYCENDDNCKYIANAKCQNDTNICTCKNGHEMVNETACAPLLEESCFENQLCALLHSSCRNDKCKCNDGFIQYSKEKCLPHYIRMYCEDDDNCKYIANSECRTDINICICKSTHKFFNETTCAPLLGESCFENQLCAPLHSSCRNDKCKCNDGFIQYSKKKCLPHYIRMYCEDDDNCKYIANSECRTDINICICKSTHKFFNETTCAPLLGESCFENQLCAPLHSSCRNDKCKCNDGFIQYSKKKCLPHYIRMYCEDDDNCKYIANSECRTDINICVCKSTHKFFNEITCAPLLGEHCKPNEQCAIKNSHSGSDFIPISCREDSHCSIIKYAVCSSDDNCKCKPNYVPLSHDKCLGTIGEYCNSNAECYSYNTVCLNNICQCSDKFYASSKTHCDPKKKYYPVNEFECLLSLYGDCLSNDDCRLNSTVCIYNQCKCQDNFSPISETQCRPDDYFYRCDQVIDCGDPWHYTCNADKKCRCKNNHFSINRSTCSPDLKGYCWNDTQCTTHNSTCVDFHCKCNDKFVGVSNNLCLPGVIILKIPPGLLYLSVDNGILRLDPHE
ncbi:Protein of unknown function [Cotesia congregata]|uniref:EGF-like domain-containing protein n=1 Tax=Cotesia congregata TaxID=51543 RepID=A0A8J2HQN1_COTCN|nr:Protein of unknown function [Cotesia congregata]